MTVTPIHPQLGFFDQTVAETGIAYHDIVRRPRWNFREADERARKTISQAVPVKAILPRVATIPQQRAARADAPDGGNVETVIAVVAEQSGPATGPVDS